MKLFSFLSFILITNFYSDSGFRQKYDNGRIDSLKTRISTLDKISQLKWLIGSWENVSNQGNMYEKWQIKNDSAFIGESYFIKGNDTLSAEMISLEQTGQDLFYIPLVKNQNDGKPVLFLLTSMDQQTFVFENPIHDFPQKITYQQVGQDSLIAKISGSRKGKPHTILFPMKKVK